MHNALAADTSVQFPHPRLSSLGRARPAPGRRARAGRVSRPEWVPWQWPAMLSSHVAVAAAARELILVLVPAAVAFSAACCWHRCWWGKEGPAQPATMLAAGSNQQLPGSMNCAARFFGHMKATHSPEAPTPDPEPAPAPMPLPLPALELPPTPAMPPPVQQQFFRGQKWHAGSECRQAAGQP